jgi:hypothetical protein
MRRSPNSSLPAPALTIAAAIALSATGCGGSHSTAPVVRAPHLPIGTPGNSAPDSTVMRWVAAYAAMVESEYDSLLTSDFHYRFSAQTDPQLATVYGNGWGKFDEMTAYHHELNGFTNSSSEYVSPMIAIVGDAVNVQVYTDAAHPDSDAWYKYVPVTSLDLAMDVNTSSGTTTYNVSSAFTFLLVRGDAAVLSPGQDHSTTRWYIRECDDLATPIAGTKRSPSTEIPLPAAVRSWGSVRSQYRS